MKILHKKYSILYLVIMILFSVSCTNELDLFPQKSVSPSQLGSSDLEQLLNGVYNKSTVGIGERIIDFDLLANHLKSTPLFAGADVNFVRNELSPTETEDWWLELYEIIYNANTVLEVINNLEGDFNNEKATALYFRAMTYYYLVTRFGGVPLLPQNTVEIVPRSTTSQTWDFIITDLEKALPLSDVFFRPTLCI